MSVNQLSHGETAYLCRSLAGLLHAGISVSDACYLLAQVPDEPLQKLFRQLGAALDEGASFADALEDSGRFPAATAGLLRTGEYSGKLEEALLYAADFHETREHTARQLKAALGYPLLLAGLMLTVVGVLLVQVLPVFDSVYASLGTRLTGLSALLLQLGQGLKGALPVLFALLLLLGTGALCCRLFPALRNGLSQRFGKYLDDRGVRRSFNNAQFAQALAMGIGSGLMPEEAISLAAGLLKDSPSAHARCRQALLAVEEGASLSDALCANGLIAPAAGRMLSVGIRGGNADRILQDVARRMQSEAESKLQDLIARIEPALVVISSLLVGVILLSVMLPLMNIMTAMG